MNIKVNDNTFKEKLVLEDPCLITDGDRVMLINPKKLTATLVAYLNKIKADVCDDLIGSTTDYSAWDMSKFKKFKGSITLSND